MGISVAIYVRLSDEDRDKQHKSDESESIQNQKSMLSEYCRERNWDIYDIYNDEDFSGTDRNRPEFKRMINDCENGRVNLVLCKEMKRFSREQAQIEMYLHDKFLEWGVRFKSVVDNMDTDDKSNKKTRQISALVNEWYVEETSESIRAVLKHKREQGQFTGSFAPYGYSVDPKNKNHLIIDEPAAENVRLIFDLYNQGNGYRKIVQTLNDKGIPSPTLYKELNNSKFVNGNLRDSSSKGLWTNSTIYAIIRNETYTGTLVQGKSHSISYKNHKRKAVPQNEWIKAPNVHEAIIDKAAWNNAQERLNNRIRSDKITQELSPLSGKVKCAVCGKPMKRNVYWNKNHTIKYYGLQCATYKTGAMNCSNVRSISGIELERFLVQQINLHIQQYCSMDKITLYSEHQRTKNSLTQTLSMISSQIFDKESKIAKMYEDYADGFITASQYSIISEKLTNETNDLKLKCEKINEQLTDIENEKIQEENTRTLIDKYSVVENLTRDVVNDFVESVLISDFDNDGKREIIINWKI